MLRTKFRENWHIRSGEENFWRVFTIYGHGGHLGHVTSIMSSNFQFLVPESFHTKFGFLYVHDIGPRARNDLDLQYSHPFINSIRCLLLPTFRSLAAIVSEKSSFHFFVWKSPNYKIWPCREIGQGHSRVIIWTNHDGQESPILHTKFNGN